MRTLLKVAFYSLIFLAHVYTVYHIQYNAGFMEETILAFTVGFMNSSEYTTYLNLLFDAFYCTLIALYFFSRWSSKEVENESEAVSSVATFDPEALEGPTNENRVTEQQPVQQIQQQQQKQQEPQHKNTTQQQKGPSGSPKPRASNNQKSKRANNGGTKNKNKQNTDSSGGNVRNDKSWAEKTAPKAPKRGISKKDSITLENGVALDEDATSGAICGVTGSVATGDLTFSFANFTFFDVICISFVFPLSLLAIYLGWNMQTSVEISWISWRWLWGWWTERWTWWRLACCLLAVVGITVWVKPRKADGKSD